MGIKFGTDGWRALVNQDFTDENVRICAQAVCDYMKSNDINHAGLIIGYDTRASSQSFAQSVAEVAAGNNIPAILCENACPTPVVSYNLVLRECGAGVVITASHNSADWNGFKFKPGYGGSASSEIISNLEKHLLQVEQTNLVNSTSFEEGKLSGLIELIDPKTTYLNHLAELVDLHSIRNAGLNIVIDSMYGAGARYFSELLSGGNNKIEEIRSDFAPTFPGLLQPEPIKNNLQQLMNEVIDFNADIGLATDGDADRLGIIDENGNYVSTLISFSLLCQHLLENLSMTGPIIKSITMTNMIDKLAEINNVEAIETPVGFKNLGPVFMEQEGLAAGEESGGYAFQGHIPERDGILSGLLILDMMIKTQSTLSELIENLTNKVGEHFYIREDIPFKSSKRKEIDTILSTRSFNSISGIDIKHVNDEDGFKFYLQDDSWVLVRFSGTEPLLRLHAESKSLDQVESLVNDIKKSLKL